MTVRNPVRDPVRNAVRDVAGGLGASDPILALFANGEQGAYYDPSDSSTVFQDAAMTTPAGADDPVGAIMDKSGNGNHATQATAAARPVLRQSGALWYLEFDGTDDLLRTSPYPISTASGYSAGAASRSSGVTAIQSILDADGGGAERFAQLLRFSGSNFQTIAFDDGSTSDSDGQAAMTNGTDYVGVAVCDGTNIETFRGSASDGSTALTGALDTGTVALTLGSGSASSLRLLSGRIYAAFHRNSAISDSERGDLEAFLAEKSGVTL